MKLQKKYSIELTNFTSTINNLFDNHLNIFTKGISSYIYNKFNSSNQNLYESHMDLGKKQSLVETISQISHILITSFAVVISAVFVLNSKISIGELTMFVSLTGTFTSSLSMIFQIVPMIKSMEPIIDKINQYSDSKYNQTHIQNQPILDNETFNLKASQLSLKLDENVIFKNIDFDLNEGEKVALVGANGSGKSMLSYIILGLIRNYQGSIKLNGEEISKLNKNQIYNFISYIPQNPILFDGTIRENLCFDQKVTDEILIETIKTVGLFDWLLRQSDGIDTKLINDNAKLSGGEKQRLLLARSILENKPCIVLDEPDSAIDEEGKEWLMKYITKVDKTIIMITHSSQKNDMFDDVIKIPSRRN
jgi:ABC-type bacteriocin/lantibiotic exporter with double-glycine peptidase domain